MKWYRSVMAMELRKILAYRSDFWVTFLGQTLIQLLIARALWQNIFHAKHVSEMNGFSLSQITLYYLLVPLGNKILTGENMGFISREIYDGSFSRYLIYPISAFQYKHLTYLTHSLFYSAQLVLMLSIYCFISETRVDPIHLLLGLLLFNLGSFVYCCLSMMVELLSLWADNIWSLMVMLRFFTAFMGGGMLPLSFFPEGVQILLSYTPFPYLVNLPITLMMGRQSLSIAFEGALILMIWGLLFWIGTRLIWSRGQKQFSGVGI